MVYFVVCRKSELCFRIIIFSLFGTPTSCVGPYSGSTKLLCPEWEGLDSFRGAALKQMSTLAGRIQTGAAKLQNVMEIGTYPQCTCSAGCLRKYRLLLSGVYYKLSGANCFLCFGTSRRVESNSTFNWQFQGRGLFQVSVVLAILPMSHFLYSRPVCIIIS